MGFNDTISETTDYFCPDGSCVAQPLAQVEQQLNVTGQVDEFFANEQLKSIVETALEDITEVFEVDTSSADAVIESDNAGDAAQTLDEETSDWDLLSWLGW